MKKVSKQSKAERVQEKALQKEKQQDEVFAKALAAFLSSYLGADRVEAE